jgi:hypothetical protein
VDDDAQRTSDAATRKTTYREKEKKDE